MPATTLTATTPPARWSTTGGAVTMTAADTGNGNDFALTSSDMLVIAHNTHATTTYTVTITSQADPLTGRTGNVAAQNVAAGEIRIFRLTGPGWVDTAGKINLSANNASIKFGVIPL